ncbi:hypothetical protein BOTBODRAFT_499168 [Botryobasidium botryosum FD-172 SS1]|uniref:Uncharacterized protein n=1 Tax=Botryobasidium botryosum (strain FD-172 SS1) TaxID=930990 RepID=A0A067M333_BOTB1|nr:hypothetical protein BOTBODRAFT_499168 [Botryobasidium botryosum FD-172 SS1]
MDTAALERDDLSDLRAMLAAGGDVEDVDSKGMTRLHLATMWASLSVVRLLIDLGANVHARDNKGRQPLHIVAFCRSSSSARSEVMRLLLDAGAALDAKDSGGDTPLSLANHFGLSSSVKFLLAAGADSSCHGNVGCRTPQFVVDFLSNPDEADAVAALLRLEGGARDNDGHTLLDRAAWLGSPAAVKALLDAGANPNLAGRHKCTPLHFAATLMDHPDGEEAVCALCDAGANVDAVDSVGRTPLHYAAERPSASAVQLLLRRGASPLKGSHDGFSPLHYAFLLMGHPNGSGAVASLLDAGADANAANSGGLTPLHYAAGHHVSSAVSLLLKAGANPRACDNNGDQSLSFAVAQPTITALLEAGSDLNDSRPLGNALYHGSITAVKLLMKAGATLPASISLGQNFKAMMYCLQEHFSCMK